MKKLSFKKSLPIVGFLAFMSLLGLFMVFFNYFLYTGSIGVGASSIKDVKTSSYTCDMPDCDSEAKHLLHATVFDASSKRVSLSQYYAIESGTFVKEKTSYSVEQDTYLILDSKGIKVETKDRPVFTTTYSKGSSYTHINGLYCENHVSQGKSIIKGAVASAMLWKNPFLYVTFILTVGFVAVFIYLLKKSKSTKQS